MGKNIMKTNRVVILMMIMLGFVQILKTEAKFSCPMLCSLQRLISDKPYALCFVECVAKCEIPPNASKCVSSCGVSKTITVDIGIYSLTKFVFVYCFYYL